MRLRDTRMHCVFQDNGNPIILRKICWREGRIDSLSSVSFFPFSFGVYTKPFNSHDGVWLKLKWFALVRCGSSLNRVYVFCCAFTADLNRILEAYYLEKVVRLFVENIGNIFDNASIGYILKNAAIKMFQLHALFLIWLAGECGVNHLPAFKWPVLNAYCHWSSFIFSG